MTTWSKSVYSTMASEIGWNEETGELEVTWKNGRRSAYADVPEHIAEKLANAPSVGQMLNMEIKPNYAHRYIG